MGSTLRTRRIDVESTCVPRCYTSPAALRYGPRSWTRSGSGSCATRWRPWSGGRRRRADRGHRRRRRHGPARPAAARAGRAQLHDLAAAGLVEPPRTAPGAGARGRRPAGRRPPRPGARRAPRPVTLFVDTSALVRRYVHAAGRDAGPVAPWPTTTPGAPRRWPAPRCCWSCARWPCTPASRTSCGQRPGATGTASGWCRSTAAASAGRWRSAPRFGVRHPGRHPPRRRRPPAPAAALPHLRPPPDPRRRRSRLRGRLAPGLRNLRDRAARLLPRSGQAGHHLLGEQPEVVLHDLPLLVALADQQVQLVEARAGRGRR